LSNSSGSGGAGHDYGNVTHRDDSADDAGADSAPHGVTRFEPTRGRHARHSAGTVSVAPVMPVVPVVPVVPGPPASVAPSMAYSPQSPPADFAAFDPHDADPDAVDLFGGAFGAPEPTEFAGGHFYEGAPGATATLLQDPPRRGIERERRRRKRHRRLLLALVLVILLVVAAAGWVGYKAFAPKPVADWSGEGTGQTTVTVKSGDGAQAIGTTLVGAHVVASVKAFTRAAAANSHSADIAPGVYQLHLHMSAAAAVDLLLDPAAHLVDKLVLPEGTIEKDVITKLATALNVSASTVAAAAANIANLGLPDGYAPASGPLTSAEGFLFPDTYSLDPGTSAAAALQLMTSEFTSEDHSIGFADGAKKIGLTPYQALIIASIAQGEVKFDSDAPKVARVILNRLAANMPLQIDATSVYGAKVQGLDPSKVTYATLVSPYNTYLHAGLPPTPIGNPGESILKAAITPDDGNWLYYVNGDAAGHLFFTNDQNAFAAAVAKCQANNWGC
jgi:UPF0755 protein